MEHALPWLRLFTPILLTLGMYVLNGIDNKLDLLTERQAEARERLIAVETREQNAGRVELHLTRRIDEAADRLGHLARRVLVLEQRQNNETEQ